MSTAAGGESTPGRRLTLRQTLKRHIDSPVGYWAAFRVQGRILGALFFRNAEARHGQPFALGYLASGLEPLIIIAAIGTLFSVLGRSSPYGTNLLLFIGTGVFPIYLFIHTSMRMREPLAQGQEKVRYSIERPLDHIAVHMVLHALSSTAVAVLYFGGLYFIMGDRQTIPFDIAAAIESMSAIFLLGVGMGIFNSIVARLFPFWNTLWPGIARASLHFSAPYFVADYLTPTIRRWFALNPILHGVDWFRHAFYPFYPRQIDNHFYIIMAGLVALTLGLVIEVATRPLFGREE